MNPKHPVTSYRVQFSIRPYYHTNQQYAYCPLIHRDVAKFMFFIQILRLVTLLFTFYMGQLYSACYILLLRKFWLVEK